MADKTPTVPQSPHTVIQAAHEQPGMGNDPVLSAKAAGLRYITDAGPGITRRKNGQDFSYLGPDGKPITSQAELTRIRALGIPPAYRNVWISPLWNGHLQATGKDAKGRKQYRYHPRWREVRDETKYGRMIAFGEALPQIRKRVDHDLGLRGLPREKMLATIVRLLEETHIRIGNEQYARANASYGLTTLQNTHVDVTGTTVHFHFRGKSGKDHAIDLRDPRLAKIIMRSQELPGEELFEYMGTDGEPHTVSSEDVNAYLQEISGQDFTAKDFRTWAGTALAAQALAECEAANSPRQAKKNITGVIKCVAAALGNTPEICRKCYVHPAILAAYTDGSLREALRGGVNETRAHSQALRDEENAMMDLLRQHNERG
jgi:DNA topoisomerase-1